MADVRNPKHPMNPFDELCRDKVRIQFADGNLSSPYKCSIGKNSLTIFDKTLDVTTSDKIIRDLPNGKAEVYEILDVTFSAGMELIPPSFKFSVRRQGSMIPSPKSVTNNITISNSHSFQLGNHNAQNIINGFQQLIKAIDESNASVAQKQEAKGKLKALLEHPLVSTLVGSAVTALLQS